MVYTKNLKIKLHEQKVLNWYLKQCDDYENGFVSDYNVNWLPIEYGYDIYIYTKNGDIIYEEKFECETAIQVWKRSKLILGYYERNKNVRIFT